jgi:hypothetical protein
MSLLKLIYSYLHLSAVRLSTTAFRICRGTLGRHSGGIVAVLEETQALIRTHFHEAVDLAQIPAGPAVYDACLPSSEGYCDCEPSLTRQSLSVARLQFSYFSEFRENATIPEG